jgi:hypothetical protein
MENVGVLIFFAVLAAFICAKARVPAGAVVFALIALVLFVGTPVGEGLPGAVATFVGVVDDGRDAGPDQRARTAGRAASK